MKSLIIIIVSLLLTPCSILLAQTKEAYVRKGNNFYKSGKFSEAEVNYLKSLSKNKIYDKGLFNLGNAYYKQKNYEKAGSAYQNYSSLNTDKNLKAKANYNLGNTLFQAGKFEDCVNAYKNALRNNPNDDDTKYNLSLASRMLKQQQQQNKDNKDQKDKKDQNKENQDKQQQQKQQEEKQQEQKQQQAKQDEKKLSKEDAERMLQAINNKDKELQKNREKKNIQVSKIKIEKNW